MQPKAERAAAPAALAWLVGIPRVLVGMLLLVAIGVMLAGVFLRYVMVPITDSLGLNPINFFWVEELGEMLLAWMTLVGASVGIAEQTHFTVTLFTQHLSPGMQRTIRVINHVIIAAFGGVVAWQGWEVAALNQGLTSPALQISMGWLYGALVAGGVLIALVALSTLTAPDAVSHHMVE